MTLVQTALKEIHYGGPKLSNDTQGPCPDGFHVPLTSERASLCSILTSTFGLASNASTMNTYLKMPNADLRYYVNGGVQTTDRGYYWSSSANYGLAFAASWILPQWNGDNAYYSYKNQGLSIRAFKDTPVVPDSNWTTIYQGSGSAGIFHNATLGLISVSGDGTNWTTIQDKNLGATAVYNSGDTLSEANCGKFYQWGNNYGFPRTGTFTTYTTQEDASSYGPGNYYNSNHFYWYGSDPNSWDSSNNANLWGGTTGTNEAMKGPCDTGFHIPSNNEWSNLYDLMITGLGLASNGITMKTYLLTPYNGRRTGGNNVNDQGSYLYIWTSTQRYNTSAYDIVAGDSGIYQAKTRNDGKSYGCAIRPFKNEAVQPDTSRTVLYQ